MFFYKMSEMKFKVFVGCVLHHAMTTLYSPMYRRSALMLCHLNRYNSQCCYFIYNHNICLNKNYFNIKFLNSFFSKLRLVSNFQTLNTFNITSHCIFLYFSLYSMVIKLQLSYFLTRFAKHTLPQYRLFCN